MIAKASADIKAQSNPDDAGAADLAKRYPKSTAHASVAPGVVTEQDALVAYLQMLGTLVDFKIYDDKANIR
jgi:cytochrome c oxidase cbb3-type subunit 2